MERELNEKLHHLCPLVILTFPALFKQIFRQDSAESQDSKNRKWTVISEVLVLHLQQRKHEYKWSSETHTLLSQNIPRVSSDCF